MYGRQRAWALLDGRGARQEMLRVVKAQELCEIERFSHGSCVFGFLTLAIFF